MMLRVTFNNLKNIEYKMCITFYNYFNDVNLLKNFNYFLFKSANKKAIVLNTKLKILRFNLKNQNQNNIGFYRAV